MTRLSRLADTIYAIATGEFTRPSGLAVVRISGPRATSLIPAMTRFTSIEQFSEPRRMVGPILLHAPHQPQEWIDKVMMVRFEAPKSFTGEDVVELHVHGSHAVLDSLLSSLSKLPLFRMAQPGEFLRRAFDHDKLDLLQIDALADLLRAETRIQQSLALKQMAGAASQLYEKWRGLLVKGLANVEAYLDFGEDEHIESSTVKQALSWTQIVRHEMNLHLNDARKGEILCSGIRICLVGAPNAGKSTLMNILAKRRVSLVSDIPGTTRDVLETTLDLGGFPVRLMDTAGQGHLTNDPVELMGISLAENALKAADIRLCIVDASQPLPETLIQTCFNTGPTLLIYNKMDLTRTDPVIPRHSNLLQSFQVSCLKDQGTSEMIQGFVFVIQSLFGDILNSPAVVARARVRQHFEQCLIELESFHAALNTRHSDVALATESLRRALQELAAVTGRGDVETVLDALFKDFCIGK